MKSWSRGVLEFSRTKSGWAGTGSHPIIIRHFFLTGPRPLMIGPSEVPCSGHAHSGLLDSCCLDSWAPRPVILAFPLWSFVSVHVQRGSHAWSSLLLAYLTFGTISGPRRPKCKSSRGQTPKVQILSWRRHQRAKFF